MTIKEYNSEILTNLVEELNGFEEEDFMEFFTTLNIAKAEKFGFRRWSKEGSLYLIPECLHEFLPNGLKVTSIMGNTCVVGKDYIDDDSRSGLLAYGVHLEN